MRKWIALSMLIACCLYSGGCGAGSRNGNHLASSSAPVTEQLTLGPDHDITPFQLSAGKSSHKIVAPGTPLDNVIVATDNLGIPNDATITFHYNDILTRAGNNPHIDSILKPLTPLIWVEASGIVSTSKPNGSALYVTFPLTAKPGETLYAITYDANTGKLGGYAPGGTTPTGNTFVVSQFETNSSAAQLRSRNSGVTKSGFFVAAVSDTDLNAATQNPGFRVGVDNCPFVNYGSYKTPIGNCLGTSLLNVWHYDNFKSENLYALLDNYPYPTVTPQAITPQFWQDDSKGYRLVSEIQDEANKLNPEYREIARLSVDTTPEKTFKSLVLYVRLFNEPQIVELWTGDETHGHAVVAYAVVNNDIFVCDPNEPTNINRKLTFTNGAFLPYPSSLNAATHPINYTNVLYIPRTDYNLDSFIQSEWSNKDQSGNSLFPNYSIALYDGSSLNPLTNDVSPLALKNPSSLVVNSSTINLKPTSGFGLLIYKHVSAGSNDEAIDEQNGQYTIPIHSGDNLLGLLVYRKNDSQTTVDDEYNSYVDFRYISINQQASQPLVGVGYRASNPNAKVAYSSSFNVINSSTGKVQMDINEPAITSNITASAYDPKGNIFYGYEYGVNRIDRIDAATGEITNFDTGSYSYEGLCFDTNYHRLIGISSQRSSVDPSVVNYFLDILDPDTGALIGQRKPEPKITSNLNAVTFDPDGQLLYCSQYGNGKFDRIDVNTGAAADYPVNLDYEVLVFDKNRKQLIAIMPTTPTGSTTNMRYLAAVSPTSGQILGTPVWESGITSNITASAYDPTSGYLYCYEYGRNIIDKIQVPTGELTPLDTYGYGYDGLAVAG